MIICSDGIFTLHSLSVIALVQVTLQNVCDGILHVASKHVYQQHCSILRLHLFRQG